MALKMITYIFVICKFCQYYSAFSEISSFVFWCIPHRRLSRVSVWKNFWASLIDWTCKRIRSRGQEKMGFCWMVCFFDAVMSLDCWCFQYFSIYARPKAFLPEDDMYDSTWRLCCRESWLAWILSVSAFRISSTFPHARAR